MVDVDGRVVDGSSVLAPGSVVFLYRDLPDEVEVPFGIPVIHRDDNIIVVDKPHFLSTMPRGGTSPRPSWCVCAELDMPELSPRTDWTD